MKKILLSLVTVLCALYANAHTVFDFDNNYQTYFPNLTGVSSGTGDNYVADGEFNSDATVTVDGITVTIKASAADASTRNRIWATAPRLRMYNESMTVSAPGHKISKISFKGHSTNFNITASAGTLTGKEWLGTGNESEVVFSVSKNTQINTMTITLDEGAGTPEEVVDITNKPETAYTVSKAHELITADKGLDKKVYVKGTIKSVTEISTSYGNATYVITDGAKDLEVYRGYGLGGDKFTSEDDIQDGDEVIVYGILTNYNGKYEFTTGSQIYSLNGKTKDNTDTPDTPDEPYTLVGNGTIENPYTTEDIIKGVYKDGETITGVWVKGVILGCFNSAANPIDETKDPVESNLALGDEKGENIIPVALVASKDAGASKPRIDLNLVANPDNKGKVVYVFGDITTYFKMAGLKNTSDYSWDGKTSSILSITSAAANKIFNLNGQKLSAPQKGINIINGVKVLVK